MFTSFYQGAIPLHLAAQNGYPNVVSLLLSKFTSMLHTKDKRGRTSLMLAAANGHLDMVTLLVGQGADINASDKVMSLSVASIYTYITAKFFSVCTV